MLKNKSINNVAIASLASAGLLFGTAAVNAQCPYSQQQQTAEATQLVAYQSGAKEESDIVDTAVAAGDFGTLVTAVKAAGLVEALKGDGPFTVLAPTDEAFEKIPKETLTELLKPENKDKLTAILLNHVIKGKNMASDVASIESVTTVGGGALKVNAKDGGVMIGDAKVTATDIGCSNGVIHVIDTVLMPSKVAGSGTKTSGKKGMKDGAEKDIVDTAVAAGKFKTLVAAVTAADLAETLKGEGPFTVFAPSDAAFEKIPKETIEMLLLPENKKMLQSILTYHVVPGKVMAADVVEMTTAKTANGQELTIEAGEGGVMINGAKVVATDIECENGVIHVVDTVLMPESK